jgi:YD repeat-containing protein
VGNLLRITDAEGGVTSYLYDERQLLKQETFPGSTGGTRSYTYDPGRRLITRTQQGAVMAEGN